MNTTMSQSMRRFFFRVAQNHQGPGKHKNGTPQSVHGKLGSSISDDADALQIYRHFLDKYDVKYSSDLPMTPVKAREIDGYLEKLPEKFTKNNTLFEKLDFVENTDPQLASGLGTSGQHKADTVTIFTNHLRPTTQWTAGGTPLQEALYHELGESLWRQIGESQRAEFDKLSFALSKDDLKSQLPNERYAIWFSKYWVGDDTPPEIQKWVE